MSKLKVVAGDGMGREYSLGDGEVVIGRRESNFIFVDHPKVSRSHAQIVRDGEHYIITDMQSSNGTFVNNQRIGRPCQLKPGDEIRIGGTTFRFFSEEEMPIPKIFVPGYTLKEVIAQGGMGTVFRATQTSMERDVALKILHMQYSRRREFVERFVQEARSAGKLTHPNIIAVHDVGKASDTYYFSMELIDGNDLSQVMGERDLGYEEVMNIGARVADALDYAHQRGIVHRDIKPDNIMVTVNGDVKVADLGIAKLFEADDETNAEGRKKVLGTPHYMSPEQARGEVVDGRSDLYSLGATLYHVLAGQPPFDGPDNQSIMVKHLTEEPVPLGKLCPGLPKAVIDVVNRLMSKKKEDRFATGEAARDALEAAAKPKGKLGTKVATPTSSAPAARLARKNAEAKAKNNSTMQVTIFVVVLLVAVVVLKVVTGGDVDANVAAANAAKEIADATTLIADADEMVNVKKNPQEAVVLYQKVLDRYPNAKEQCQTARDSLARIRQFLATNKQGGAGDKPNGGTAKPVDVIKTQEALWKGFLSWHEKNKANKESALKRLDGMAATYPDLVPRIEGKRKEIMGADYVPYGKEVSSEPATDHPKTLTADIEKDFKAAKEKADAAAKAKKFDTAIAALDDFRSKNPGVPQCGEAENIIGRYNVEAQALFDAVKKKADDFSSKNKTCPALKEYEAFIAEVECSEQVEKAKAEAEALRSTLTKVENNLEDNVKAAIMRCDFDAAGLAFDEARPVLEGSEFGKTLEKRSQAVKTLASMHQKTIAAISEKGLTKVDIDLSAVIKTAKPPTVVTGASERGLAISLGEVSTTVPWDKLTPPQMLVIYQQFAKQGDDEGKIGPVIYAAIFKLK